MFNDLNSKNKINIVIVTDKKSENAPAAHTPFNPINKGRIIVNGINKIVSMLENNEKYGPIEEYKWQYISERLNDILKG